jgi:hypothetical protein
MLTLLKSKKTKRAIVSLFFNRTSPGTPLVGKVAGCDDNGILISAISPIGLWDGFQFRKMEHLFKAEGDGEYEKKIETLFEARGETERRYPITLDEGRDSLTQLIDIAEKSPIIVGVGIEDSEEVLFGTVHSVENKLLRMTLINEFGRDDGFVCINKEAIDFMELHSIECRSLELLRKSQK